MDQIKLISTASGIDDLMFDESEIAGYDARKTHTGMGVLRATLASDKDPTPYAQRKDRCNLVIDGSTEWTGVLVEPGRDEQSGRRRIKALGIATKLEQSRPDYETLTDNEVRYQQTALQDAIRDYWNRTSFTATVTDQTTEVVSTDEQLILIDSSQEWTDNLNIADTDPVFVENGFLKQAKTAFVNDMDGGVSRTDFSGGSGVTFSGAGQSIFYNITNNYDIENPKVAVRCDEIQQDEISVIDVFVDGELFGEVQPNAGVSWETDSPSGVTLPAGSHNVEVEAFDGSLSFGNVEVDIVTIYDGDYPPTFDDTVHKDNGYLDGPQEYADSVTVETNDFQTSLNITEATINPTYNDITNEQAIGLSFDTGTTVDSAPNTSTHTATSTDASRTVRGSLTLSGHPFGTDPQTATPRFGYRGQTVDSADIRVDLDNLVVIDDLALRGNHFENLQQLHEYGDFPWVIEHDDDPVDQLTVVSFRRGEETRPRPDAYDEPLAREQQADSTPYHNAVYLRGGIEAGSQPTAQVEDTDEIDAVGERIEATVKDPKITTSAGAQFRAQALLDRLTDENERRGRIEIPLSASITHPGYAREVDFGDGPSERTLEEVRLRRTARGDVRQEHNFAPPADVSRELEELKRNARDTRDKV